MRAKTQGDARGSTGARTPSRAGTKATLLACIGAAACLIASCARPERGPGSAVREGALAAYPKESVGLVAIEVEKLRKVKPEARWLESIATEPTLGAAVRELQGAFGADLLETVTRLSLAIVPQPEHRVSYGLMIERKAGTGAAAKPGGAAGDAIRTLQSVPGQGDLNATSLADGTLVIGPRSVLETIRSNAAHPGSGLETSQGMLAPIDKLPGGSHIWGAVDFQTLQRLAREAAQSRGATLPAIPDNPTVNTIVSLGFHGKVGKTLNFGLMGLTTGEKEAKNLGDTARALLALARAGVNPDQKPEWFDLLDSLTVAQNGLDVSLKGTIPEKTLDAFASQARAAAAAAESPAGPTAATGSGAIASPGAAAGTGAAAVPAAPPGRSKATAAVPPPATAPPASNPSSKPSTGP